MEGIPSDSRLIEGMLGVEKKANMVLEEAKEKAPQMVIQARSAARKLAEKTREDLQREWDGLEHRLHTEGEEETARIIAEKEQAMQKINDQGSQQRDQAVADLREIVSGDLYVGLRNAGLHKC